MPTLRFKGTVLPPSFPGKLEIHGLPTIRYQWAEERFTVDFSIDISASNVEVKCDANRYEQTEHLSMLSMHAHNLARAAVDCWCFCHGIGLEVYLGTVVHPNGEERGLAANTESVMGLCEAFNLDPATPAPNNYDTMVRLFISDPFALMALNDLVASISQFEMASINCGRAMEALRNAMTPDGMDREDGWPIMRSNLNISESYIRSLTSEARGPRHGGRRVFGGISQGEAMARAWKVMNRFLEFRKRGNVPLPESDFRTLDC